MDGGRCCDIVTVNQRALVLSLSLRVVVPGRRVVRVPTWVWLPCEPVMAGRPSAGIAPNRRFPLSLSLASLVVAGTGLGDPPGHDRVHRGGERGFRPPFDCFPFFFWDV